MRLALNSKQYFSLTHSHSHYSTNLLFHAYTIFFLFSLHHHHYLHPHCHHLRQQANEYLFLINQSKTQAINRFKNNLTSCPTGIAGQVNKFYAQKRPSNQALLYHWGCWGSVTARIIQSGSPLTSWDSYLSCSFLSIPFSYIFCGPQCKLLGYQ